MAEPIPLSGGIDPRSFPYLLADLHRQQATGSLRVEGRSYQKALYLRSGRVLFGSSNDPRDQLGTILVESGRLTAEQLEEVNSRVGPGNPLAKLLAESGSVSQRELAEIARSQVERILSDLLTYDRGSYEFEDGVLPKGTVDLKLSTERLMLAASRRVEERAYVLRHIESLQTVLSPHAGGDEAAAELRSEIGDVLDRFDGEHTLKDVASASGNDDFDTARIACALLFLGVLQPARDTATAIASGGPFVEPEAEPRVVPEPADGEVDLVAEAVGGLDEGGDAGSPIADEPEPAEPAVQVFDVEQHDPDATVATPSPDLHGGDAAAEPDLTPARPAPELVWQPPAELDSSPPTPTSSATPPPDSKPSREDSVTLDTLLDNRALEEGPLEPLEKPAESDWNPQFLSGGRAARAPSGSSKLLLVLLGVVVVPGSIGGGIYAFGGLDATLERIKELTSGTQVAEVPPAPDPVTQPMLATPTPDVPATAPDGTPAPASTDATPLPAAAARAALRGGRFADAARGFAAQLRGSAPFTLQVLVACSVETLTKANQAVDAPELYLLPVNLDGRECYRVCWGLFASEAEAGQARDQVHRYFTDNGAQPHVVRSETLF